MAFIVYILQNPLGDTYVGQTTDLVRRVLEHNDPRYRLTMHNRRQPGPWRLIHQEEFATVGDALKRERALKTDKGREEIVAIMRSHEASSRS